MLRFVGNGDQKKFTKNPRHFSMQNSQANTDKQIHKLFLERRQSNKSLALQVQPDSDLKLPPRQNLPQAPWETEIQTMVLDHGSFKGFSYGETGFWTGLGFWFEIWGCLWRGRGRSSFVRFQLRFLTSSPQIQRQF